MLPKGFKFALFCVILSYNLTTYFLCFIVSFPCVLIIKLDLYLEYIYIHIQRKMSGRREEGGGGVGCSEVPKKRVPCDGRKRKYP